MLASERILVILRSRNCTLPGFRCSAHSEEADEHPIAKTGPRGYRHTLANKAARVIWAIKARGGIYRVPQPAAA
jgi:hypothetical protein